MRDAMYIERLKWSVACRVKELERCTFECALYSWYMMVIDSCIEMW